MAQDFQIIQRFNHLPQLAAKLPVEVNAIMREWTFATRRAADPLTPVDTSNLANNVGVKVDGARGEIHWRADYAAYVEFGAQGRDGVKFAQRALASTTPVAEREFNNLERRLG